MTESASASPRTCGCKWDICRYLAFLENCDTGVYPFQIFNHNLLLAGAIHQGTGRRTIRRIPAP